MFMSGHEEGGARISLEDIFNSLFLFLEYVYNFIVFDNILVLPNLFESC